MEDDVDDGFAWRVERFLDLRCQIDEAMILACVGADWHEAERLRELGCPARLLVDLLG